MECVAAIDQGTQSTRVFIFDKSAKPLASHQEQFKQIYPKAGWCEHDPLIIWGSVQRCIEAAVEKTAAAAGGPVKVVSLGITNQRETTLVWSRNSGKPLYNAIVWLDNRTSKICRRWEIELPDGKDHFRPITGLPISTYFSAYKFQWLLEHVPEVAAAVASGDACFGTIDSWLIYCLTGGVNGGVHVTDVTNASRTNLMDLSTLNWHAPFLSLFRMPPGIMPRIASNAEVYGHVAEGPLAGVPIAGCLGDQMAALLGQRAAPGEAKNTYGTGCFMLLNTGSTLTPSSHGLLTTLAHRLGPTATPCYALEGSVAVAGLGISWLRDNLRIIDNTAECEDIAKSVPDTGGVYFVPAFGGLLAPHWEEDARGALLGMTAFTTRGHVVRAMLEAICFQTREVLEAMILDTAGMQHSASCPDLDPAVLEAAGGGGGGGLSRSRLGSASNSMSRLAIDSSAVSSSSMPPSMTALAPSLQQQQQQHQSGGGGGGGGGVALKARDTSGDGGRVSISSWGSSQQLLGGSSGYSLNLLRVDGGATNNNLLMQLQSDILQVPVQRPHFQETTALGAALAAGYTVGFWDMGFLTDHPPGEATTFIPEATREEAARRFKHWKKAVGRCLDLADLAM